MSEEAQKNENYQYIISERNTGKTTNKVKEIIKSIATDQELSLNQNNRYYIWLQRKKQQLEVKSEVFKSLLETALKELGEKYTAEITKWNVDKGGVKYEDKRVIHLFSLENASEIRGVAFNGNPWEIIFDDCVPQKGEGELENEKEIFAQIIKSVYIYKGPMPTITFIGTERKGWMFGEDSGEEKSLFKRVDIMNNCEVCEQKEIFYTLSYLPTKEMKIYSNMSNFEILKKDKKTIEEEKRYFCSNKCLKAWCDMPNNWK